MYCSNPFLFTNFLLPTYNTKSHLGCFSNSSIWQFWQFHFRAFLIGNDTYTVPFNFDMIIEDNFLDANAKKSQKWLSDIIQYSVIVFPQIKDISILRTCNVPVPRREPPFHETTVYGKILYT